jgi:predicted flap endonuclease-1-like 5' DNA nuclease
MNDSNTPVIDLTAALDPSSLQWWIEFEYSESAAAIAALLERFATFQSVTAAGIADDFTAGHAADFAKALKDAAAALDEVRTRIKRPVLHAQRLIDGEARKLTDPVTAAVREVEARVTVYLRAKEEMARTAARAEAERLALEAEARIADANTSNSAEDIEAAVETMDAANRADEVANARALELTRTRGLGGALTALADRWVFEVVDIARVPTHLLQVNDSAVRALVKQGARDIPGLRIWNDSKAMIR